MSTAMMEAALISENPFAPNPNLMVWFGTELVPVGEARISVFDHGLLYGDGIFEGIRVYNGKIFKEAEHLQRFVESAKAIRLDLPMTVAQISDAMYETLRANGVTGDGYIRLLATRGIGLLGISVHKAACPTIVVISDKISLYPAEVYDRGLRCVVSSYARNHVNAISPRVKSLNYLNNVMAKLEAYDAGADEAVLLNSDGQITECTGDNIFLVRNKVLMTPPASAGILEGVTRGVVMELAKRRNLPVHETVLVRHDLYVADECFATGTAAEIVPITEVDKRLVGDGRPGPITKRLIQDFIIYRTAK